MLCLQVVWERVLFGCNHKVGEFYVGWFPTEAEADSWRERLVRWQQDSRIAGEFIFISYSLLLGEVVINPISTNPSDLVYDLVHLLEDQLR